MVAMDSSISIFIKFIGSSKVIEKLAKTVLQIGWFSGFEILGTDNSNCLSIVKQSQGRPYSSIFDTLIEISRSFSVSIDMCFFYFPAPLVASFRFFNGRVIGYSIYTPSLRGPKAWIWVTRLFFEIGNVFYDVNSILSILMRLEESFKNLSAISINTVLRCVVDGVFEAINSLFNISFEESIHFEVNEGISEPFVKIYSGWESDFQLAFRQKKKIKNIFNSLSFIRSSL